MPVNVEQAEDWNGASHRGRTQVHQFQADFFDLVLSSFGVMFFDDPAAGLSA